MPEIVVVEHSNESVTVADKYYFLVRRLHSLTGLIPIGAFLFIHLLTNVSVLAPGQPGAQFQKQVESIHELGFLLKPVEIFGIFIPLAFHTLIGFQIILAGKPNSQYYRYGPNIRYTLQRATGVIAFVFILYHLWQMHWVGAPFGGGTFQVHDEAGNPMAAVTAAGPIQSAWWVAPVYAVGILAAVFHLANGIWTSLITWGITIRPRTQQISGYVCAAFGVLLAVMGLGALSGFKTFNIAEVKTQSEAHTVSAMTDEP